MGLLNFDNKLILDALKSVKPDGAHRVDRNEPIIQKIVQKQNLRNFSEKRFFSFKFQFDFFAVSRNFEFQHFLFAAESDRGPVQGFRFERIFD
jgi:hypothetical protein